MEEEIQSVKIEETPFDINNGVEMQKLSHAERAEKLNAEGITANLPADSVTESYLPEEFQITNVEISDYEITNPVTKVVNKTKGLRIAVIDDKGNKSSCSLSRCTGLHLVMNESRQFPNLAEIGSDSNGNITLFNRVNLSVLPNNKVAIYDFIGKKFTAKKVNVFNVPFQKKYVSKNEALDMVKAATVYEVKAI